MGTRVDMKVVLLGKEYGGKTSIVERFIHDRFNENIPYQNTIGAAFGAKVLCVDKHKITLGIWDTAGSERYEAMSKIYYRGAKAAIICFDLTDDTSFDRAKFWVNEVRAHEENCMLYLAGTKKDLMAQRSMANEVHDITDYAEFINASYFETSSKTGENIGMRLMTSFVINDYASINSTSEQGNESLRNLIDSREILTEEMFQKIAEDFYRGPKVQMELCDILTKSNFNNVQDSGQNIKLGSATPSQPQQHSCHLCAS